MYNSPLSPSLHIAQTVKSINYIKRLITGFKRVCMGEEGGGGGDRFNGGSAVKWDSHSPIPHVA